MGRLVLAIVYLMLLVALLTGYIVHILWAVGLLAANHAATVGQYILAVVGVFIPPLGAIHGIGWLFGAW